MMEAGTVVHQAAVQQVVVVLDLLRAAATKLCFLQQCVVGSHAVAVILHSAIDGVSQLVVAEITLAGAEHEVTQVILVALVFHGGADRGNDLFGGLVDLIGDLRQLFLHFGDLVCDLVQTLVQAIFHQLGLRGRFCAAHAGSEDAHCDLQTDSRHSTPWRDTGQNTAGQIRHTGDKAGSIKVAAVRDVLDRIDHQGHGIVDDVQHLLSGLKLLFIGILIPFFFPFLCPQLQLLLHKALLLGCLGLLRRLVFHGVQLGLHDLLLGRCDFIATGLLAAGRRAARLSSINRSHGL